MKRAVCFVLLIAAGVFCWLLWQEMTNLEAKLKFLEKDVSRLNDNMSIKEEIKKQQSGSGEDEEKPELKIASALRFSDAPFNYYVNNYFYNSASKTITIYFSVCIEDADKWLLVYIPIDWLKISIRSDKQPITTITGEYLTFNQGNWFWNSGWATILVPDQKDKEIWEAFLDRLRQRFKKEPEEKNQPKRVLPE